MRELPEDVSVVADTPRRKEAQKGPQNGPKSCLAVGAPFARVQEMEQEPRGHVHKQKKPGPGPGVIGSKEGGTDGSPPSLVSHVHTIHTIHTIQQQGHNLHEAV